MSNDNTDTLVIVPPSGFDAARKLFPGARIERPGRLFIGARFSRIILAVTESAIGSLDWPEYVGILSTRLRPGGELLELT